MTREEATKLIARHKLVVTGDSFHKLEALIDFAQAAAAAEREAIVKLTDSLGWVSADDIREWGEV